MERFERWLAAYGDAWTHQDADAVRELFSPGARYQVSPFSEPLDGVEAIRDYWAEGTRHSGRDVQYAAQILATDGNRGVAHWQAEFTAEPAGHRVELNGILVATLDDNGRCTDFREWWHRLESHD